MKKWEYTVRIIDVSTEPFITILDKLGQLGWELVSSNKHNNADYFYTLIFKKKVKLINHDKS